MSFFGSTEYYLEVQKGNIPGEKAGFVVGKNPYVGATNTETIWDQGGNYTYLTADTQLYISSTSASDTSVLVIITGLDEDYVEVTRTVTTNGQNQVAISGLMLRVHAILIGGSTSPVGDLYLAETDSLTAGAPNTVSKIKGNVPLARDTSGAIIDSGTDFASDNFSHLGIYTVPAGKTAYLIYGITQLGKNFDITIGGRVRSFGGVWFNRFPNELYQNTTAIEFRVPLAVPEKTDLEWRVIAGSAGSSISFQVQFILVDNPV